jgi:hypothetical protein
MNTFQADIPVTVEKRLYFDGRNGLIKELQTVYEMNTKKVVDARICGQRSNNWSTLNGIGFLK